MRIGLIYDKNIPLSVAGLDEDTLAEVQKYAEIITLTNFCEKFEIEFDCLVNMHGRYFIKSAWWLIKDHLQQGRGFINIGEGVPFSIPISCKEGVWTAERAQTAYHEEINIRQGMVVKKDRLNRLSVNSDIPILERFRSCFALEDTTELTVQFTHYKDTPNDQGSSGPMDAVMYPLLTGYSESGRKMAAPVVMIENIKGVFEGGRWIFINQRISHEFWKNDGVELIRYLSEYSGKRAYEINIRPNYASYHPGEQPVLLIQVQSFGSNMRKAGIEIQIAKDNHILYNQKLSMTISDEITYKNIPVGLAIEKGMYLLTYTIHIEGEGARTYRNGFWGYDRELMESGSSITCGRDYFQKDGKPMPVVGMTYMQSDVHRKFIYLPNVYKWDTDFTEMKNAGVNMVRTGIWTAHRTVMFNDGIASEEILRALDAFFLTARKYDIPVVFNFFSFTPEVWEGVNPYLDPRSVKAQKRFISSIVSRHCNSSHVSWDLINEPSLCSIRSNWKPVPNRDGYELAEWRKWLKERHKSIEELQERWNCSPTELSSFENIELPENKDFDEDVKYTEPFKPLKILDYILFTQYVMNRWASEMIKTMHATGSKQLVTVGQDEGLNAKRPSPLFYQEVTDYTTCHSWWLMDDLYWDGVFSKTPDKPNLIQETGIMYVQNADGKARRTEEELRDILERKYAYAFASNNAGAIHWIWNTNIYMDSVNEVNIGAIRADGTQKLEADVTYEFGELIRNISYLFENRREEEIAVIFPYSNNFSVRDYAVPSTKHITRVLGYNLGMPFKVYGEYHLDKLGVEKLIILPNPRTLTQHAWEVITDRVGQGSVLLITGPFSYDEYWNRINCRAEMLQLETRLVNISREETLYIRSKPFRVSFGGDKIAWVEKEVETAGKQAELKTISYGKGKIIWSPLPIEVNEQDEIIEEVYKFAFQQADMQLPFEWIKGNGHGILGKKLIFSTGSLYLFVSESSEDTKIIIKDMEITREYEFILPSNRVVIFAIDGKGEILKSYRNIEVETRKSQCIL